MTPAARYLLSLAITCAVLAGLYTLGFVYQLGAPVAAEYWVPEMQIVKRHLAGRISGRKVVIVGGSSAHFGLDSALIERETGRPTVNLALHAGLSLDYLLAFARTVLRPGDTVVLALEYAYYASTNPSPSWFASNIMAWDPQHVGAAGSADAVAFAASAPAKRVVNGVATRLLGARLAARHPQRALRPSGAVIAEAEAIWRERRDAVPPNAYSFRSIDEHGDSRNTAGSFDAVGPAIASVPVFTFSPEVGARLRRFQADCRVRDVAVFIAWPALPAVPGRSAEGVHGYLAQVRAAVTRELSIPVLGAPEEYTLEPRLFFDSFYHPNEEGRAIGTRRLLSYLTPRL